MGNSDWTVIKVRGEQGLPAIDGLQFLACLVAVRGSVGDARWHYRWMSDGQRAIRDGFRIELPFGSVAMEKVLRALEARVPPPDGVFAEPMRIKVDLDPIQDGAELDECLTLLWRYSEFLSDLTTRNPQTAVRQFMALTSYALLTFMTGDRRHLEAGMQQSGFAKVPVVPLSRVADLVRAEPIPYRLPPRDRKEAVSAVRIHHLAACTFASEYYPFARIT
jgi:hypothetical protein